MKTKLLLAKVSEFIGLLFIGYFLKIHAKMIISRHYINERTIEYMFVLKSLLEHKKINILDIGTGSNSFASTLEHCGYNVTATDLKGDYWKSYNNRHIYVERDDITNTRIKKKYDAIICISVLEHIKDYDQAIKGMLKLLTNEGILIITFPYSHDTYCENIYQLDEADSLAKNFKYIGRSFSNNEVERWCRENELKIVSTCFTKGWSGKYWRTGKRYNFPKIIDNPTDANMACFLFKKINNLAPRGEVSEER